jgi:hypothetical protein
MPSAAVEALSSVAALCRTLNLRWYLFGGQAALLYGVARLSADVDITVLAGETDRDALLANVVNGELRARPLDAGEFCQQNGLIPCVHRPSGLTVDLVLGRSGGLEEGIEQRALIHTLDGVETIVASPEDIILLKLLSGAGQDLEDVRIMAKALSGVLDQHALVEQLRLAESALQRRDLIQTWHTLTDDATP